MSKNLSITALLGLMAIILGAFATHSVKEKLVPDAMESIQTAIRYQVYHVLVLLFINTYKEFSKTFKNNLSILFFLGIFFFSGSIYTIYLLKIPANSIWFVTPLGGLLFVLGWFLLFFHFVKKVIDKK
ncbi:MAG: DUF423 domain-containing protein [Flavobacteriaceae bacterium]|nr:MAG: DUF423 domain-containing protein [Flavobacteriaceae bacterium]